MKCWQCGQEASGICIFCGRAVCKKCAKTNPNILAAFDEDRDRPRVITVGKALWCGQCQLKPSVIDMPEIEDEQTEISLDIIKKPQKN